MNMITNHKIIYNNSKFISKIPSEIVNLIVTSPPYPMIEMWDNQFSTFNKKVGLFLENKDGDSAYRLMHEELEKTWAQFDRILCKGGIVCINIGDATRKIGDTFKLYSNHSRITHVFENMGFDVLPSIIWRKQTNKPNKFMGSGMYPGNAYVTLEHEYILIFRKNGNRKFLPNEIDNRRNSAYFWEERNNWFSDIWLDLKGIRQNTNNDYLRQRSAAFPFELAYRLINMYSVQGDTVCDPFLGTGTTTLAAIASMRNSIGYEIDKNFQKLIDSSIGCFKNVANQYVENRVLNHLEFLENQHKKGKNFKYLAKNFGFDVMTNQEKDIFIPVIKNIDRIRDGEYNVDYSDFNLKITKQNETNNVKNLKKSLFDYFE
jgi:modification methylase